MHCTDRNILWRRKQLYIPFTAWGNGGIIGGTNTQVVGPLYGNKITAVGTGFQGLFRVPHDLDPNFELGMRIHYCGDGTAPEAVGTLSFIALLNFRTNAAVTTAAVSALNTPIPTTGVVSETDNLLEWTERGIRNKGFLSFEDIANGAMCQFSVELDAVGGTISATNFVVVAGVEFDYMVSQTRYPHAEFDGPIYDEPK